VPFEGRAHPFLVTETTPPRDLINVEFGFFEQATSSFYPKKLESFGRSSSGPGLVTSSEVSRAHIHLRCEHIYSQLLVLQIFRHP
jgi:pSer/pThr/pTyr-binding forkhead associated (FHA) protein